MSTTIDVFHDDKLKFVVLARLGRTSDDSAISICTKLRDYDLWTDLDVEAAQAFSDVLSSFTNEMPPTVKKHRLDVSADTTLEFSYSRRHVITLKSSKYLDGGEAVHCVSWEVVFAVIDAINILAAVNAELDLIEQHTAAPGMRDAA